MATTRVHRPTSNTGAKMTKEDKELFEVVRLSPKVKQMASILRELKPDEIKIANKVLTGCVTVGKAKLNMVDELAYRLDKKFERGFDGPLSSYNPVLRDALVQCLEYGYALIDKLERTHGCSVLTEGHVQYYWSYRRALNAELGLDLFVQRDEYFLRLPPPLDAVLAMLYHAQPVALPDACENPGPPVVSVIPSLQESIPMLIAYCGETFGSDNRFDLLRKRLVKKIIKEMRARSGIGEFPLASKEHVDPLELLLKLIMSRYATLPERPSDGIQFTKDLVDGFLNPKQNRDGRFGWQGEVLEFHLFMGYLTKTSTGSIYMHDGIPSSRSAFGNLLKEIAGSGQFYRVEELMETQRRRGVSLVCFPESVRSENLHHKGVGVLYQGEEIKIQSYARHFSCGSGFSDVFVGRPLFRAYCYLFAALGVLEIVEGEAPALVRLENNQMDTVSPYDHVTHIRVTPFGAWALGVSNQRPQEQKLVFEAITDKDLLLVTFRGKSLERKLFLEQIGQKLGEERYRISEASFIKGCSSPKDVLARIDRFRTLIDEHPSPRWETFFASVLERTSLFRDGMHCIMYDLSTSRAARDLVASDAQVRQLVMRVEGNKIAVHESDHQKFLKVLEKLGWMGQ